MPTFKIVRPADKFTEHNAINAIHKAIFLCKSFKQEIEVYETYHHTDIYGYSKKVDVKWAVLSPFQCNAD